MAESESAALPLGDTPMNSWLWAPNPGLQGYTKKYHGLQAATMTRPQPPLRTRELVTYFARRSEAVAS